jgi:hypothetical protein
MTIVIIFLISGKYFGDVLAANEADTYNEEA